MSAELSTAQRLVNGARVMGGLWRSKQRCPEGWSDQCGCEPKTRFCQAKGQWAALLWKATEEGEARQVPEAGNPYWIIEAMKTSEFDATGLTLTLESGVKIGPAGSLSMADAARLSVDPSTASGILKILETFPKSKVAQA